MGNGGVADYNSDLIHKNYAFFDTRVADNIAQFELNDKTKTAITEGSGFQDDQVPDSVQKEAGAFVARFNAENPSNFYHGEGAETVIYEEAYPNFGPKFPTKDYSGFATVVDIYGNGEGIDAMGVAQAMQDGVLEIDLTANNHGGLTNINLDKVSPKAIMANIALQQGETWPISVDEFIGYMVELSGDTLTDPQQTVAKKVLSEKFGEHLDRAEMKAVFDENYIAIDHRSADLPIVNLIWTNQGTVLFDDLPGQLQEANDPRGSEDYAGMKFVKEGDVIDRQGNVVQASKTDAGEEPDGKKPSDPEDKGGKIIAEYLNADGHLTGPKLNDAMMDLFGFDIHANGSGEGDRAFKDVFKEFMIANGGEFNGDWYTWKNPDADALNRFFADGIVLTPGKGDAAFTWQEVEGAETEEPEPKEPDEKKEPKEPGKEDGSFAQVFMDEYNGNKDELLTVDEVPDEWKDEIASVIKLYAFGKGGLKVEDLEAANAEDVIRSPSAEYGLYSPENVPLERLVSYLDEFGPDIDFAQFRVAITDVSGHNMLSDDSIQLLEEIYDGAVNALSVMGPKVDTVTVPALKMSMESLQFNLGQVSNDESINPDNLISSMVGEDREQVNISEFPQSIFAEVYTMFRLFGSDPDNEVITVDELQNAANAGVLSWELPSAEGESGQLFIDLHNANANHIIDGLDLLLPEEDFGKDEFVEKFGTFVRKGGAETLSENSMHVIRAIYDKAYAMSERTDGNVSFDDIALALSDGEIYLYGSDSGVQVSIGTDPEEDSGIVNDIWQFIGEKAEAALADEYVNLVINGGREYLVDIAEDWAIGGAFGAIIDEIF